MNIDRLFDHEAWNRPTTRSVKEYDAPRETQQPIFNTSDKARNINSISSKFNRVFSKEVLGCMAAGGVTLIWAMWLVVSRMGAQSPLNAFDLAAIRYGVSAVATLPIVIYFKPWRDMSLGRIAGLSMLLGPGYILCVYFAFDYAPAAHGGIFMNGALPAITLLFSLWFLKQKSTLIQLVGVVLILIGAALSAADISGLSIAGAWRGDVMFVIAGVFFAGYLVAARAWGITPTQVMFCSSIVNALLFVPVWYFLLPSGLGQVGGTVLYLQVFYQGLLPGLLGLILVAYATRTIGPAPTSAFIAAVPGLGVLLGIVFLKEIPGAIGWIGLLVLTPGILMVSLGGRSRA